MRTRPMRSCLAPAYHYITSPWDARAAEEKTDGHEGGDPTAVAFIRGDHQGLDWERVRVALCHSSAGQRHCSKRRQRHCTRSPIQLAKTNEVFLEYVLRFPHPSLPEVYEARWHRRNKKVTFAYVGVDTT